MDYKYARYVALASIIAQEHLKVALAGRDVVPSIDVLRDAARIGVRKARERVFPGLVRDPFKINPLDDVVLGLRYYYEGDPENYGMDNATDYGTSRHSSSAAAVPDTGQTPSQVPTAYPRLDPSDTREYVRRDPSDTREYPRRDPSDTTQYPRRGPSDSQQYRNPSDTQQRKAFPFSPGGAKQGP